MSQRSGIPPNFKGKLRQIGAAKPLVRLWPELISTTSCQSQLHDGTTGQILANCAQKCMLDPSGITKAEPLGGQFCFYHKDKELSD